MTGEEGIDQSNWLARQLKGAAHLSCSLGGRFVEGHDAKEPYIKFQALDVFPFRGLLAGPLPDLVMQFAYSDSGQLRRANQLVGESIADTFVAIGAIGQMHQHIGIKELEHSYWSGKAPFSAPERRINSSTFSRGMRCLDGTFDTAFGVDFLRAGARGCSTADMLAPRPFDIGTLPFGRALPLGRSGAGRESRSGRDFDTASAT